MKVRDIQRSHNFREFVNKWGEPFGRKRIFIAPPLNKANENNVVLNLKDDSKSNFQKPCSSSDLLYNIDREIDQKRAEHDKVKTWIAERKALRQDLDSLGLRSSWFQKKPNKTESEFRVFQKLTEEKKEKEAKEKEAREKEQIKPLQKQRLVSKQVDMLPFLNSPLPIALAIISDYLQDNRMRLVDLFSKVDKNKDWMMTRNELKYALKETSISLTDSQLDELIITLDANDDDQLSYKEMVIGIEAYHKDRRWRKLKTIYDGMLVDDKDIVESKSASADRKAAIDLLRLPKLELRENGPESTSRREKRFRKQQERKDIQRQKKKPKKSKVPITTTISGSASEKRLKYLEYVNDECNRCIDILHSAGIMIKTSHLKHVLLPPEDNSENICQTYLSIKHSAFPQTHPLNRQHRKQQKKNLKSLNPSCCRSNNASLISTQTTSEGRLPRVASLEFNKRASEGRKRRQLLRCSSPTPCWPQHLLDKLYLCMDNSVPMSSGKNVIFNHVKGTM